MSGPARTSPRFWRIEVKADDAPAGLVVAAQNGFRLAVYQRDEGDEILALEVEGDVIGEPIPEADGGESFLLRLRIVPQVAGEDRSGIAPEVDIRTTASPRRPATVDVASDWIIGVYAAIRKAREANPGAVGNLDDWADEALEGEASRLDDRGRRILGALLIDRVGRGATVDRPELARLAQQARERAARGGAGGAR